MWCNTHLHRARDPWQGSCPTTPRILTIAYRASGFVSRSRRPGSVLNGHRQRVRERGHGQKVGVGNAAGPHRFHPGANRSPCRFPRVCSHLCVAREDPGGEGGFALRARLVPLPVLLIHLLIGGALNTPSFMKAFQPSFEAPRAKLARKRGPLGMVQKGAKSGFCLSGCFGFLVDSPFTVNIRNSTPEPPHSPVFLN